MNEFTCTICQRKFDSYKGFQNHNSRTHKINGVQTFIDVYYNGIHPVCKCGCNERLNYQNGKFGEYIRGHKARVSNGFYTREGIDKSSATRREQFKSGARKQWNADKQMTEEWKITYRLGWQKRGESWKNSLREARVKQFGYESWQQWYDALPERKRYYYDVWRLTEDNVHLIENYDPELRGIAGKEGAYQVDHIIPISIGFARGMQPYEIAAIENLRFIPWQDNLEKGSR